MSEVTKQNLEKIGDLVRTKVPKLDILNYFPYGKKTTWEYWLTGKVDLREEYKNERNKWKTEKDYAYSIIEEVGRAMNYLIVHGTHPGYDNQRILAFALHDLFRGGIIGWTKKPLKGLSEKEKEKLYKVHDERADLIYSRGKYATERDRNYEAERMKERTPAQRKEYEENERKHKEHNRKKYGIYYIEHLPLIPFSNTGCKWKSLYNLQELAAIDLMVSCYFENLC